MNDPTPGSAGGPSSAILPAILISMLSAALFTGSHGIVRHIGNGIHPFEIAFFSNLFSFFFYVPWIIRNGPRVLRTDKFPLHFIRSFINAAALTTWYMALAITPLADATALALTAPLFVTLGAILFLGEKVGSRRWLALGFGAIGALFIIRPGFEAISIGLLLVLVSQVFSAGTKLFAKHLSRYDSPMVVGAYVAMLQTPITFIPALFVWTWPTPVQLAWLLGVGMLVALAHISLVLALSKADASFLEPFVFVRLIYAALIGYFAFAELPEFWTWVGALIIVGSTTYVARREYLHFAKERRTYTSPVID